MAGSRSEDIVRALRDPRRVLLDTRSSYEFDMDGLRESIHIPHNYVEQNHELLPNDKSTPIIAYCGSEAVQSRRYLEAILAEARPLELDSAPGVAVLVRKDGCQLFQYTLGITDLTSKSKISPISNFRLASVSKQFTAMAIMTLERDGKLKDSTTLGEIFPEFPEYGRAITVKQLLEHNSGVLDYEEVMTRPGGQAFTSSNQLQDEQVFEMLLKASGTDFPPGSKFSYSNTGYILLGLICARLSGKPFDDFLFEAVFEPLGMKASLAFVPGKNSINQRCLGHARDEKGDLVQRDQSATSATLGDGGFYSSLEDLAKWDDGLTQNKLISKEEFKRAITPFRLKDGSLPDYAAGPGDSNPHGKKEVEYGFGWFVDPYKGDSRMWHYGVTCGFRTCIQRFLDSRLTVIVLLNRNDVNPITLALGIADKYL